MWQDVLVPLVRLLVNDDGDIPTYSDEKLESAIVYAALNVSNSLAFAIDYVPDLVNIEITPDPTEAATLDNNYINLITIFAACIIDRGAASKSAGQAIRIRDGTSEIDLRDTFKARYNLIGKFGWCAVYEAMRDEYITSQGSVTVGAVILTPFGINRGFNSRGR